MTTKEAKEEGKGKGREEKEIISPLSEVLYRYRYRSRSADGQHYILVYYELGFDPP